MEAKKITDALNTKDKAMGDGSMVNIIVNEYSTINPFNCDSTRLLLIHKSYFALYDSNGLYLRDLPFEISASSQPRWSKSDRDIFCYLSGNSIKEYNIASGNIKIIRTFTEYLKIDSLGEADISEGGTKLILCGDGKEVFVFTLNSLVKGPVMKFTSSPESLYFTPNYPNVLVSYHVNGTSRFQGIELYDQNLNFIKQVLPYNTHKDLMTDPSGEDILIHGNGNDPNPNLFAPAIISTRLKDNLQTLLFKSSWEFAAHISCPIDQNFFFIDRYDPAGILSGEIIKVYLDSSYEVLCYHESKPFLDNTYTYQPKVACNDDGTKIVFSSNHGINSPQNYSDVYLLNLAKKITLPVSSFKGFKKVEKWGNKDYIIVLHGDGTFDEYEQEN